MEERKSKSFNTFSFRNDRQSRPISEDLKKILEKKITTKSKKRPMSLNMYSYRGRDNSNRSFSHLVNNLFESVARLKDERKKLVKAAKAISQRHVKSVLNSSFKRKRDEESSGKKFIRTSSTNEDLSNIGSLDLSSIQVLSEDEDIHSISSIATSSFRSDDYTDMSSELTSGTEDDVSISRFGTNVKTALRQCYKMKSAAQFRADEYNIDDFETEMVKIGISKDETIRDLKSIFTNDVKQADKLNKQAEQTVVIDKKKQQQGKYN